MAATKFIDLAACSVANVTYFSYSQRPIVSPGVAQLGQCKLWIPFGGISHTIGMSDAVETESPSRGMLIRGWLSSELALHARQNSGICGLVP